MTHSLTTILEQAKSRKATDIHLSPGDHPAIRISGNVEFLEDFSVYTQEDINQMLKELLSKEQYKKLGEVGHVDTSKVVESGERLRVHVYRDDSGMNVAVRRIRDGVELSENEKDIPPQFMRLADKPHGLLLIAGPTGAGKTTTRASLVEHINQTQSKHIVSLADTIEYDFENKKSIIRQRAVGDGKHVKSYETALSSALRQDPDVIVIGDLRDRKAMQAALSAAQSGHLVIAEIHAPTTHDAVSRLLAGTRDKNEDAPQILAQQFVGAIAQRLIPMQDEDQPTLATEVLIANDAVRNMIKNSRTNDLTRAIQVNRDSGMHTLNDHIEKLQNEGVISKEAADKHFISGA